MGNKYSLWPGIKIVPEPVKQWKNLGGHTLLGKMYEEPWQWGHAFQSSALLTYAESHVAPCKEPVKLMERSVFDTQLCFANNLYNEGKLAEVEW